MESAVEFAAAADDVYADEVEDAQIPVDYGSDAGASSDDSFSLTDDVDEELRIGTGNDITKSEQVHMMHMRRFLDDLNEKVSERNYAVLKTREELKKCRMRLEQLERECNEVFSDIQTSEREGNNAAVFRLQSQHDRLCQELENEAMLEAQIRTNLDQAEYDLAKAEVEQGKYLLVDEDLKQKEEDLSEKRLEQANERNKKEEVYTIMAEQSRMQRERQGIEEQRERERRFRQQQDEKRRSKEVANRYLKETMSKIRRQRSAEEFQEKQHLESRIKSMLALKRDITANRENLRALQARDKAIAHAKEEAESLRRQEILDEGGNPNRELLKKQTLQQYDKQKQIFDAKQRERQTLIAHKILQEDDRIKKRMTQQPQLWTDPKKEKTKEVSSHRKKKLKVFDQNSQKESTDTELTLEDKVIKSDGVLVVDPGESSDEDTGFNPYATIKRDDLPDSDSEGEGNTNLAKPEFEGLWDQHKPYKVPKDLEAAPKPAGASKMDQEIMARVMEKHREGIVIKQVAGGREFKGQPFYSKPDVIHFKDFDVGKTYKKKVTLTNVSYSVNYCKLIGITEHLKDFIHIHFDPPGQMSAGLTCEMLVTFQPMINEDLAGEVNFLAQTGPFSIPLICSTKKCDLSVDMGLVDFGTTVIGETLKRSFTLTNNGALASKFEFVKITGMKQRTVTTAETSLGRLTTGDIHSEPDEAEKSKDLDSKKQADAVVDEGVTIGDQDAEGSKSQMMELGLPPAEHDLSRSIASSVELPMSEFDEYSSLDGMKCGQVTSGEVGPFSSVKLDIVWQPTIPGGVDTDFAIHFSDPLSENIPVKAVGNAIDVPVWVERHSVDMKICLLDRLYQDTITVNNRATTALRLKFEVCNELKNHMELLPKTGYIQAQSQFSAQLKFLPRHSLFEDGGKYFDKNTGVLEAPMTIRVADQTRPVEFTVHAVVTNSDMEFSVVNIDFGHCTIYESVKAEVKLTNKSILPQQFGFLGIPDYVDVQPNDGFGTLLPLETINLDIIFKPKKARVYNFELTCKSLINREFKIFCQGVGVHPPLEISHQVISFAATAVNDVSVTSIHVVNSHTSMNEYTHPVPRIGRGDITPVGPTSFEFVVPDDAPLTVSPSVGTVLPGKKCKVHVRFAPKLSEDLIRKEAVRMVMRTLEARAQREYEEALQQEKENEENNAKKKPAKGKASPKGKSGKANESTASIAVKGPRPITPPTEASIKTESDEYAAAQASLIRQYQSEFSSYVIPCYVASGKLRNPGEMKYSIHNTLYLEVHCPSVKPELVAISDSGRTITDFGDVSIGQNVVKSVTLQNISSKVVDLRSSSLDTCGTFQILNALRVLPPDGSHTMLISFTPDEGRIFQEVLVLKCPTSNLSLTLRGRGVQPKVKLSIPDNVLDMGAVLAKEYREEVFKIENTSSLSIQYSIKLDSLSLLRYSKSQGLPDFVKRDPTVKNLVGTQNNNGQNVFDCVPVEGVIPSGGSQEIMVTFAPDHPSDHYSDAARIELFGQDEAHVFRIIGLSKPHIMFMTGGDPLKSDVESLSVVPVEEPDEEGRVPPIPLLVTLNSVSRDNEVVTATRDIYAACVRTMAVSQKKNGEFSFENTQTIAAKGFSIEPQKGMVEAGSRKAITVSWTPPKGHDPNTPAEASINVTLKGDVTELYKVILRAFIVTEECPTEQ